MRGVRLWTLAAAVLAVACSPPEVSRQSLGELLASDTPRPELGELFWEAQRRQGTELWDYAAAFCAAAPERVNCAPVRNLTSISQRTQAMEDPP